ncbi:hypothetical protein H4219_003402 [Mycoemilia scoparia]|uniref:Uncharacterized protein n=1 Tax=Mycoemilia scoparia TaxID=417184 RepID=A0A9W7ZV14_9FUNG|nr:hypothetical protein H4219_003402 [Mycoemilia scoparia]
MLQEFLDQPPYNPSFGNRELPLPISTTGMHLNEQHAALNPKVGYGNNGIGTDESLLHQSTQQGVRSNGGLSDCNQQTKCNDPVPHKGPEPSAPPLSEYLRQFTQPTEPKGSMDSGQYAPSAPCICHSPSHFAKDLISKIPRPHDAEDVDDADLMHQVTKYVQSGVLPFDSSHDDPVYPFNPYFVFPKSCPHCGRNLTGSKGDASGD